MGGIPWWAALIGTPIAAGKMAGGVAETVDSLNKVNDMLDARADKKQYAADFAKFRENPSHLPTSGSYRDPEKEWKVVQAFQKEAAPSLLSKFKTDYENTTGTSDPRFFGTAEGRAELAKNGAAAPTGNPFLAASLADFEKEGAQRQTLKAAADAALGGPQAASLKYEADGTDPWAIAGVGADKDLASSFHLAQQGFDIPVKRNLDAQEKTRKQIKDDFDETQKQQAVADQSEFDRIVSGIGGGYINARSIKDGNVPTGPNVATDGSDFSNPDGTPAKPYIMPYDEARSLVMKAASDYPKANAKDALANLERQYKESYTRFAGEGANRPNPIQPSATNWMGTATNSKEQLQLAANSGDKLAQKIIAELDARELKQAKAKRDIVVSNPIPPRMDMNPLSPEEQQALNIAIAEKRLDPYKVNSKNQKVLAGAALARPGVDLNNISAELGLARNTNIQIKAATAEMLPGLVQKTVEAGKALNYSNAKFVGAVQQWKNGQLNDPKLTKYLTLRNDQLLTIGGVMRANGMTDMAQRLEEEAMHPTLSPKALDSWMEGQLESIDPRLNFYRKATKGNTAIPRANYTPKAATGYGTGATIAPAGTKVPRKGGGYYTSDGKGGWS